MICPRCSSRAVKKKGFQKNGCQRFICNTCKKQFQAPPTDQEPFVFPKILLFDIETSLMEVYVWGLYKQRIPHTNIVKDRNGKEKSWFVLSWAAKWLYDSDILHDVCSCDEARDRDDSRILKSIWKLLDEADIVIGHNGDRFDIRKLNARFLDNGMEPPSPFKTIDTLKVARRHFAFISYKQDYLTKHFKLEQKLKTEFQLWVDCMNGDQKRLEEMAEYNRHDVMGLEEVYLKIRPYIKSHPNLGVLLDRDVCTHCGSERLDEINAVYFTSAFQYPVFRCMDCKTPYIRGKSHISQRKTEMRSVAG